MSRWITRTFNDSGFMAVWGGHAILGHFKKLIRKLNVIVRLLTKSRGDRAAFLFCLMRLVNM